jgi:hypothetical protein
MSCRRLRRLKSWRSPNGSGRVAGANLPFRTSEDCRPLRGLDSGTISVHPAAPGATFCRRLRRLRSWRSSAGRGRVAGANLPFLISEDCRPLRGLESGTISVHPAEAGCYVLPPPTAAKIMAIPERYGPSRARTQRVTLERTVRCGKELSKSRRRRRQNVASASAG